eukprot:CAMPEP_0185843394 /NCGR_PEP_ID=MMETSP1353-20130828/18888_1 /TAXON_ID=1077150 /ORGANISM="Erythrolobus australicus, Strain CCMP3124" /LENGTH=101 /DNA_ID=CAMNT_0028542905 /DNA_START=2009 /DNA_END=2310 /DNA_ORIENTATION=-
MISSTHDSLNTLRTSWSSSRCSTSRTSVMAAATLPPPSPPSAPRARALQRPPWHARHETCSRHSSPQPGARSHCPSHRQARVAHHAGKPALRIEPTSSRSV